MMHNYFYHGWGAGMMGWGWLFGVVILVLLVWMVVKLTNQGSAAQPKSDSALDILRERYARGEIDKEEFDAKMKDLK